MNMSKQIVFEPYIPSVFRYLNREYVDSFFSDGTLLLSTFLKMREYPDEQRGDKDEGHGTIKYEINDQAVQTDVQVGIGAYILCTSLLHSTQMYEDFQCNSCIEIKNPLYFANLVALKIRDVDKVLFGPCQYVGDRVLDRNPESNFPCVTEQDFTALFQKTVLDGSYHVPFRKHLHFCSQHEYRFLWEVSSAIQPIEQPLTIKVPEAIPLCNRLDASGLS